MNWNITRIEMAKMVSNYAINVLWLKKDKDRNCFFYDVDPSIDVQYDNWITKACQLWLMWLTDDWDIADYFNPDKNVTRWQRATIFSRLLNKSRWEEIVEWNPYYRPHLKNLLQKWLIIDENSPLPNSNEKKGNGMIMMYRADPLNKITVDYMTWYTKLEAWQIYRNDYFGIEIISTRRLPWLVSIEEYYDNFYSTNWYSIVIYNYVDKKFWNLKFDEELYLPVSQNDAKKFWESWFLLEVKNYYIYNKDETLYNELVDEEEWLSRCLAEYLNDNYILQDCDMGWQEPMYVDVSELRKALDNNYDVAFTDSEEDIEKALDTYNAYQFNLYYDRFSLRVTGNTGMLYSILTGNNSNYISDVYKDIKLQKSIVEKAMKDVDKYQKKISTTKENINE